MSNGQTDEIYQLGWPITLIILAFLLVLAAGCYEVVEPVCGELPAEGLDSLEVRSDGGSVTVERVLGADVVTLDGEIHIHAASTRTAGNKADDITLEFSAEGTTALLVLDIPRSAQPAWGELILTVPEDFDGHIETENAPVVVDGLDGDLRVVTTNGAVTVNDVAGSIDLVSTNGMIVADRIAGDAQLRTTNARVEVTELVGAVDFDTTNGAVDLSSILGSVDGRTTNGKVTLDDHRGSFDISTTNAKLDIATDFADGGQGHASSTNGHIDLSLPSDVSTTLDAETTNGDIDIDGLEYDGQLHEDWASIIIGSGDGKLVLSTTNGSIDVGGHERTVD